MDVLERKMTWALGVVALAAAILTGIGLVSVDRAFANKCLAACQSARNGCRISTKNSPSCEQQFTRCLQGCRKK
jgi:hypothetical protein